MKTDKQFLIEQMELMLTDDMANFLAEYVELPSHIRMEIIERTETVAERNYTILKACLGFYANFIKDISMEEVAAKGMPWLLETFWKDLVYAAAMSKFVFKPAMKAGIDVEKIEKLMEANQF